MCQAWLILYYFTHLLSPVRLSALPTPRIYDFTQKKFKTGGGVEKKKKKS